MPVGKKIFFLLVALVILITYTVATFNYKTILSNKQEQHSSFSSEDSMFGEYLDSFILRVNELKNKTLEKLGLELEDKSIVNKKPISIELIKENGIVLMNGTFKNAQQAKSIVDLLNINRNGLYTFEENRIKDVILLNKVSLLMDSFKEFFTDDSKLIIDEGKVLIKGELKDSNFEALLETIIAKSNLDILTEITKPNKSKTEEIIDDIKKVSDGTKKLIEKTDIQVEKINTNVVKTDFVKKAQASIDKLTTDQKITFKRRSTNITEESKKIVSDIASILLSNSKLTVEVAGHTDSRGAASLNKRISQDRANSVKNALVDLGVDTKNIKAVGYGEDFPIAKDDEQGLSEVNRRVEFIVGEIK